MENQNHSTTSGSDDAVVRGGDKDPMTYASSTVEQMNTFEFTSGRPPPTFRLALTFSDT